MEFANGLPAALDIEDRSPRDAKLIFLGDAGVLQVWWDGGLRYRRSQDRAWTVPLLDLNPYLEEFHREIESILTNFERKAPPLVSERGPQLSGGDSGDPDRESGRGEAFAAAAGGRKIKRETGDRLVVHYCIVGCGKVAQTHARLLKKLENFVSGNRTRFSFASRDKNKALDYRKKFGGELAFDSYEEALRK